MKYLTNVVETYRVDTETEANVLIDEAKRKAILISIVAHKEKRKLKVKL